MVSLPCDVERWSRQKLVESEMISIVMCRASIYVRPNLILHPLNPLNPHHIPPKISSSSNSKKRTHA
jgi:hypothetical protein